ncbi:MAG: hypothetical protein SGJ04_01810 [Bacteroidota bacterium]|nr:hypothetical protein [Bacteroidota bacterium]
MKELDKVEQVMSHLQKLKEKTQVETVTFNDYLSDKYSIDVLDKIEWERHFNSVNKKKLASKSWTSF